MQKNVLLFGAGKSATVLIDYLIAEAAENHWKIIIADSDKKQILSKINSSPLTESVEIDVKNDSLRLELIQQADIVISLMPPSLHFLIAKDCVTCGKNLLTASYIDEEVKGLQPEIEKKGLLFLCEMGLDPGIDHMSAMQIIDSIHEKKGIIHSFKSHCGGLIAPESDNNPWHYKISWNPRNVVMAGKSGAIYKTAGNIVHEKYEELFQPSRGVAIPELGFLSYYPNRDSIGYIDLYHLQHAETFIRTTLRYTDFMHGWKNIVDLKLTDETREYETDGLSLKGFFKQHFDDNYFKVNQTGLELKQLLYLGMHDDKTIINKGKCSAADILQFALETKLSLQRDDKDMIVMLHELTFTQQQKNYYLQSSMIVKGENDVRTAMAKTVGLPLGIAVKLILNKTIRLSGLLIPVKKEIYDPVLKELKSQGINFIETVDTIN